MKIFFGGMPADGFGAIEAGYRKAILKRMRTRARSSALRQGQQNARMEAVVKLNQQLSRKL
jgi:hypothetical protein